MGRLLVPPGMPTHPMRTLGRIKATKTTGPDGSLSVVRSDIYGGAIIPFVPFTSLVGDKIKGTHNGG